jgi:hypothetical protein
MKREYTSVYVLEIHSKEGEILRKFFTAREKAMITYNKERPKKGQIPLMRLLEYKITSVIATTSNMEARDEQITPGKATNGGY